jgi:hypothetical protein
MSSVQEESAIIDDHRDHPLCESSGILASQFFAAPPRDAPECRLIVAILEDAVRCVRQYRTATDAAKRTLRSDAMRWITSRDRSWYFSFENVCMMLDLDPDHVRNGLMVRENAPMAGETASAAATARPSPAPERGRRTVRHR